VSPLAFLETQFSRIDSCKHLPARLFAASFEQTFGYAPDYHCRGEVFAKATEAPGRSIRRRCAVPSRAGISRASTAVPV
jgi:hypothetical protein